MANIFHIGFIQALDHRLAVNLRSFLQKRALLGDGRKVSTSREGL